MTVPEGIPLERAEDLLTHAVTLLTITCTNDLTVDH